MFDDVIDIFWVSARSSRNVKRIDFFAWDSKDLYRPMVVRSSRFELMLDIMNMRQRNRTESAILSDLYTTLFITTKIFQIYPVS